MKNTIYCPVKRPKIMIISSDPTVRRYLDYSLQSSDMEPWITSGDWHDLKLVAELEPDLLILDNESYHSDILNTLRELRWEIQIPMLVLGRYRWQMIDILEAGADFYLSAPYSANMLCARVEVLIRRSKMASNNYSKTNYDCCATCKCRLNNLVAGRSALEEKVQTPKGSIWSNVSILYPR